MKPPRLVAWSQPAEVPADLLQLLPPDGGVAWIRGGDGLVGWGEAARFDAGTGRERFARASAWLSQLVRDAELHDRTGRGPAALRAVASFTFDARSHGSVVVVPRVLVAREHDAAWVTVVGDPSPPALEPQPVPRDLPDRIRYAGSSLPDVLWLEAVAAVLDRIDAGEVDKVVLARDHAVWSRQPFDVRVLASRLAGRFPDCWTFLCDGLVGASPELLLRRRGVAVTARVLAGSAARSADADADRRIGEDLLGSKKDRWEHELAVASLRDALAVHCEHLEADPEPHLLRLDNVQHLATGVSGVLRRRVAAIDLAGAVHPTAAVGGTPTGRAVELIRELEGMDRGRYAGPVGWVDGEGDGELAIALRCAELSGARARLFAGAGIVVGSLPESELEETRLKLLAMRSAFGG